MSEVSYDTIVAKAKSIKENVEKNYKLGENAKWSYYIAQAILKPKKPVKKIAFNPAPKPTGDHISNQIYKEDYLKLAQRLIKVVNTEGRLANAMTWNNQHVRTRDYTYMFARILVYFEKNGRLPNYADINTKCWTKPTEYPNKVYGLWVKYIGTKPKMLDDVCDHILKHFTYQFYYDDKKSNEEVLKTKAGNCTDLLQMLSNMAEAMDYEYKIIHTQCKQSGTGHVYGKFRKKGTSNWFIRDIACIADESRYCVWCNIDTGAGYLLAVNPNWFMQNRNR